MFRARLRAADPVIAGAAISHTDLVLEAADGNRFAAFPRRPTSPRRRAWSSSPTCAASTTSTRSWRCGSPSAASPRSRSTTSGAPPASSKRGDEFDWMPHVQQTTDDGSRPTCTRRPTGSAPRRRTHVFTVGFCFGGRALVARGGLGPRARGGDRLLRLPDAPGTGAEAGRARPTGHDRGPVLALQAAPTRTSPPEANAAFDAALDRRRASSTSSSPTRARRTASSIGSTRSTRTRRRTHGGVPSLSSRRTATGELRSSQRMKRRVARLRWAARAASSVAPIVQLLGLPASLPRTRPSHRIDARHSVRAS